MKCTTVEINETQTIADKKQIAAEVMERNKFYKALKEIRQLASDGRHVSYIVTICNHAIEGIK